MSRSYSRKPENKKRQIRQQKDNRRVVLSDFELEFIELNLDPNIRLIA